ncbi:MULTISPECIES: putative phage abortive infection protein [unclassified Pseudomonas]|uniref:putative phage abortive infection protein n=1 Tax=unclassified Pseudomonas TaxID=196821 RepID=UPI001C3FF726|nr:MULTISPECIES: putative phage abortive infection protein [unclassified Pseudomonas]
MITLDSALVTFLEAPETIGVFGDFFGGVLNPLLTFLTFFCLIVTVVIQRHELSLARTEYKKTAEALSTQAVENTFFSILDLHHKIVDNIKLDIASLWPAYAARVQIQNTNNLNSTPRKTLFEGREAFEEIINYITWNTLSSEQIVEKYQKIQDRHNQVLGHYFRNLYQALKVIHNYDEKILTQAQKKKYASILRAQLSTKELILIFINGLDGVCDNGKFKNLLIEYAMLEHLPLREANGHFSLLGNERVIIDQTMVQQYGKLKQMPLLNLEKSYGGAFGNNLHIPYRLKNPATSDEPKNNQKDQ